MTVLRIRPFERWTVPEYSDIHPAILTHERDVALTAIKVQLANRQLQKMLRRLRRGGELAQN